MFDRVGDAGFEDKLVARIAVVDAGPDPRLVGDAHQLRGNADIGALPLEAAFEQILHAQVASDLSDWLASIDAGRIWSDDAQLLDRESVQLADEFVGQTTADIILAGVASTVVEGQHGDGDGGGV